MQKMNVMNIKDPAMRTFWTRQVVQVEEELRNSGVYRPKESYIRKKNGEIADFYLRLYRWFTKEASKYIVPTGDYPIWLSISDEHMLQPTDGTVILELEIPADAYLLCNYDAWGYIVNYFYVPTDEEDRRRHEADLARYGIGSDDELFLTAKGNFYPLLKREVMTSWSRVFTLPPRDLLYGLVSTAWEIRSEWVKEIRHYGDVDSSGAGGI